jgi:hypothetical protein
MFAAAWSAAVQFILASQQYLAAEASWAKCMRRAGYGLTNPSQAPALVQHMIAADSDSGYGNAAQVLTVARSDYRCQLSTLIPVRQQLELTQIIHLVDLFPEYRHRAETLGWNPVALQALTR